MRWKTKKPKWKLCFVWRPVQVGKGEWVWLTNVWKRRYVDSEGYKSHLFEYLPYPDVLDPGDMKGYY